MLQLNYSYEVAFGSQRRNPTDNEQSENVKGCVACTVYMYTCLQCVVIRSAVLMNIQFLISALLYSFISINAKICHICAHQHTNQLVRGFISVHLHAFHSEMIKYDLHEKEKFVCTLNLCLREYNRSMKTSPVQIIG